MYVEDDEFYEDGFRLDEYSKVTRCFLDSGSDSCAEEAIASLTKLDFSASCPFNSQFLCRRVLELSVAVGTSEEEQRLDRLAASLKEPDKVTCLPCPTDSALCPPGSEFLDTRYFDNAIQSATGYWQDEGEQ